MNKSYIFNNSTVTIVFGNILDSEKEVIVSSDDCCVTMGGGISWSILNAGGRSIIDDAKKQTPAKLGNVVVTTAGMLKQKFVFHAITIDEDYARKQYDASQRLEIQQFIVSHSVKQCLRLLSNLNLSSIAFPCVGAGAARIPYELVAVTMSTAISEMLLATNRHLEVEIYLYDKYHKMEPWDFLPFFERFASAEACGKLMSNMPLENDSEEGDINKFDFSDVKVSTLSVEKTDKHKIFISYSRKDYERIKGICSLLNDMEIPYWIDIDGTYSGENYKEVIVKAIQDTQLVLFVSTVNSNASLNVAKEIGLADKYNKVVIPVKLDNSPFAEKIDYDLNCIDAIDMCEYTHEGLDKLRKTIQGKLAIESS